LYTLAVQAFVTNPTGRLLGHRLEQQHQCWRLY